MFDYLLQYPTEAAATADDALAQFYWPAKIWDSSHVVASAQAWNPANDTTEQVPLPGGGTTTVTVHSYSSNFWLHIGLTARDSAFEASTSFVICLDREGSSWGQTPAQYIKAFNPSLFPNIISLMNALRWQPTFSGAKYAAFGI